MWIEYSNSEVDVFHPICEEALNKALIIGKINDYYEVIHHFVTGSIIPDYVIRNKKTLQILCVVEVKRTKNDVQSQRYQYQAQSYVSDIGSNMEKPYYVLTNLETSYLFRYTKSTVRPLQQILKPGLISIGNFSDYSSKDDFVDKLAKVYADILSSISNNFSDYLISLEDFASKMESLKKGSREWKAALAVYLYEYIRGSFEASHRYMLRDVRAFHDDIKSICYEGNKIDFDGIFEYNPMLYLSTYKINSLSLDNVYKFAKDNIYGDSVADILHSIVCNGKEHEGLVATDSEVSRFVSLLAKIQLGTLNSDDIICDPAAGSGSLISSAFDIFNSLEPKQVMANDKERGLLELLSLRIGLKCYGLLSKTNHPSISNFDIREMEPSKFSNVKAILINPPYIAGISCIEEKNQFYDKYLQLTKKESRFKGGQYGLEALFIEYISALVVKGTVISAVLPKQYLTGRGPEAIEFRKFLLEEFGLATIFNYSGTGLFNSVTKDTCILVGTTKTKNEQIKIINCFIPIQDIDVIDFENNYKNFSFADNKYLSIISGVEGMAKKHSDLLVETVDGWRMVESAIFEANEYIGKNLLFNDKMQKFSDSKYKLHRGQVGNSGESDLLFLDSKKDFYKKNSFLLTGTGIGIRNSDSVNNLYLTTGDSLFFDLSKQSNPSNYTSFINNFLSLPSKSGKQIKKTKNFDAILKIVKKESKHITAPNSVLIPRNLRKTGKIHITNKDIFVSTNFIITTFSSPLEALIIGSWMTTVYYQLICEINSKNQEGTRKMEIEDIKHTLIPNIERLTQDDIELIKSFRHNNFLNLQDPCIREIDKIWSKVLFLDDYEDKLNEAIQLLKITATSRDS